MNFTVQSSSEDTTKECGALLAQKCQHYSSLVIYLEGDLGAGKTTFTRGFVHYFEDVIVKSPTYSLVESYEVSTHTIHHFDLYRISDPEELDYIGIREYSNADATLCLFEWPQMGLGVIPEADIVLTLSNHTPKELYFKGLTPQGKELLYAW